MQAEMSKVLLGQVLTADPSHRGMSIACSACSTIRDDSVPAHLQGFLDGALLAYVTM